MIVTRMVADTRATQHWVEGWSGDTVALEQGSQSEGARKQKK